jgi:hypothetical protein
MEVIPDPLESRLDKLSRKYTTDQNGVRMKSWRPSQVMSVLQSESSLHDASSLMGKPTSIPRGVVKVDTGVGVDVSLVAMSSSVLAFLYLAPVSLTEEAQG